MITQEAASSEKVCPLFVRFWPQTRAKLPYPGATNEGTIMERDRMDSAKACKRLGGAGRNRTDA